MSNVKDPTTQKYIDEHSHNWEKIVLVVEPNDYSFDLSDYIPEKLKYNGRVERNVRRSHRY